MDDPTELDEVELDEVPNEPDDLAAAYAELEAFMTDVEPDLDEAPEPLHGQEVANAVLRRKGALQRALALKEEVYRAERARLEQWIADQRVGFGKAITKRDQWLTGWHRAQLGEHGTGPKTIRLPAGVLKAAKQQPEWEVDEETFVPWARSFATELLRKPPPREPAPDRNAIKRYFGEIIKARSDWQPGDVVHFTAPGEEGQDLQVPGVTVVFRDLDFKALPSIDT